MKIRVEATASEAEAAVQALRQVFEVQEVSRFYPNRGSSTLGRVYVTAALPSPATSAQATRRSKPDRPVRHRKPPAEFEDQFIDLDDLGEGDQS